MRKNLSPIHRKILALAPGVLALAALVLFLFGRHALEAAHTRREAARVAVTSATAEVSRTEDLLRRDQRVQDQLTTLHQQGLDRPIDAHRWHDTLGKAGKDLHVSALHYELAAERPADAADTPPSSLHTATLNVQAVLRHEEDFLALMRRLEQMDTGVLTRRCMLALTQEEDSPPRLKAHCELERTHLQLGEHGTGQATKRGDVPPLPAGESPHQGQER